MIEIQLPANGWRPRHYQADFWHYMQSTPFGARAILCHHRRAGKDHTAINWAAVASQQRVGLYIHVFPYANQGRRVIWNGIDRNGKKFLDAFPAELVESRSDLEMRLILKNGSVYQVLGADDPDKLVGINCVGAIFSEYSLMDPQALRLVLPILNENGGWAIFPSTPRGRNHFHDLLENARKNPKWFVSVETIDTTGAVDPAVVEEDRRMGVEEPLIQQEYYCSFDAALAGAYYEKQMSHAVSQKRITTIDHDPALEVHTAWDLGVNDSTCIWVFQVGKDGKRIIDFIESNGQPLSFYIRELRDRATRFDWVFGTHYGPHDLRQRELATGNALFITAQKLGFHFTIVDKHEVKDGIEAVRQLLPSCYFDKVRTERGVEALKSYRREYDERLRTYRDKPLHDWSSHAADAFRYLAMGLRQRYPMPYGSRRDLPTHAEAYDPFGNSADAAEQSPRDYLNPRGGVRIRL